MDGACSPPWLQGQHHVVCLEGLPCGIEPHRLASARRSVTCPPGDWGRFRAGRLPGCPCPERCVGIHAEHGMGWASERQHLPVRDGLAGGASPSRPLPALSEKTRVRAQDVPDRVQDEKASTATTSARTTCRWPTTSGGSRSACPPPPRRRHGGPPARNVARVRLRHPARVHTAVQGH